MASREFFQLECLDNLYVRFLFNYSSEIHITSLLSEVFQETLLSDLFQSRSENVSALLGFRWRLGLPPRPEDLEGSLVRLAVLSLADFRSSSSGTSRALPRGSQSSPT